MDKFIVELEFDSVRLDAYLSKKIDSKSRSYFQKLIEEGNVFVNGKNVKPSTKVYEGDEITYSLFDDKPLEIIESDIPLDIVYEDECLLVINKARGMVVHPSNGHYEGDTLVNALMARKDKLSSINGVIRPGIVHRIDKDTSGLLVVAKTDEAHLFLAEQLKDKTMYREYYALVEGIVPHELITIKAPIGKDKKDRLKQAVDPINGKDAVTHVTVLKRFKRSSLVSCKLETGRTHQIRLHLSYIKYPIIGDNVYGRKSHYYTSKGQMLHAYKLSFIHPLSKERVTFVAPVDEEFLRVQEILENE